MATTTRPFKLGSIDIFENLQSVVRYVHQLAKSHQCHFGQHDGGEGYIRVVYAANITCEYTQIYMCV